MFKRVYETWLQKHIAEEKNPRVRDLLQKGIGHGTTEFLRLIWYPAVGNLDHLYPEYEVRDFNNKYRYLDLAYLPGPAKGCIEIHGYRYHARDIEASRFKDLCMKQAMLTLDDWLFLPIAYLSILEDPGVCRQMALAFAGKFLSTSTTANLNWAETEGIRFAWRLLRPFTPKELATHLQLSERRTRSILHSLVAKHKLVVASGNERYRTYQLHPNSPAMS